MYLKHISSLGPDITKLIISIYCYRGEISFQISEIRIQSLNLLINLIYSQNLDSLV
jgi:predicted transport protein